jgi:[ribosomal protein S5]-alanine N-acetyltransferase
MTLHPYERRTAAPVGADGLTLGSFADADADAVAAAAADGDIARWLYLPAGAKPSRDSALRVIAHWRSEQAHGHWHAFAVRDLAGTLVGGVALHVRDGGERGEVCYWTCSAHRGRGIASRAVRAACAVAADVGIRRVEAYVEPGNHPSRRVCLAAGLREAERHRYVLPGDVTEMIRYVRDVAGPDPTLASQAKEACSVPSAPVSHSPEPRAAIA